MLEPLNAYILPPESILALLATCNVLVFCVTCVDKAGGPGTEALKNPKTVG